MTQTAKNFVTDAYQIVSANSPTVPLHGNDMSKGIQFLNELLKAYSATGLLLTVAKQVDTTLTVGQKEITFGDTTTVPTPTLTSGRLANIDNAWLTLDGVTYPLTQLDRSVFYGSYKYYPQIGLPLFSIITNETNLTRMEIYPGASQAYVLSIYGKFELGLLTENSDMSSLPDYYLRFFKLALARDLSMYKGRTEAWTEKLERYYVEAKQTMEAVSTVNLIIDSPNENELNGYWRVKSGI
jgi:hypothetical protein